MFISSIYTILSFSSYIFTAPSFYSFVYFFLQPFLFLSNCHHKRFPLQLDNYFLNFHNPFFSHLFYLTNPFFFSGTTFVYSILPSSLSELIFHFLPVISVRLSSVMQDDNPVLRTMLEDDAHLRETNERIVALTEESWRKVKAEVGPLHELLVQAEAKTQEEGFQGRGKG